MTDNILLSKAQIIERCLQRIHEEYDNHEAELSSNYTKQDSIILNLQRACEAALDMAQRMLKLKKLGLPQNYRESFILLQDAGILPEEISVRMQKMVGFRNIAIHAYQDIKLDILQNILTHNLNDFKNYIQLMLQS
jgi:uncharacterized protein YutE (UPF0331/DUF86 family)